MSWLSKLFGMEDAATAAVEGVKKGIDALVFTDQEQADVNGKLFELYVKYQEATLPQNVARRVVAFAVVGVWVPFAVITGIGMVGDFAFKDGALKFMDEINDPFMLVMGFYFVKRMVVK